MRNDEYALAIKLVVSSEYLIMFAYEISKLIFFDSDPKLPFLILE